MQINTSRILAFDPGETTGISYVVDGDFRWGMVCRPECFDQEVFLLNVATMTQPTSIVIEIPPSQTVHYNKDQSRIYERLERFYRVAGWNVISINPGQWKKLIERSKIDATHIRDATDMAKLQYTKELTR